MKWNKPSEIKEGLGTVMLRIEALDHEDIWTMDGEYIKGEWCTRDHKGNAVRIDPEMVTGWIEYDICKMYSDFLG